MLPSSFANGVTVTRKMVPVLLLTIIMLIVYNSGQRWTELFRSISPTVSREPSDSSNQLPSNDSIGLPSICWSASCRSDYAKRRSQIKSVDQQPIPAICHILWMDEFVSENLVTHLRTWQEIHPNWMFVLWRDRDMEPFVAAHFPDTLPKFKSLPRHIMRVDMIRYMLLYKYGGVYADLDYTLVRSLDQFRSNYAVLTQEPEAHSLQFLNMKWPPEILLSPAFMMSAPNHHFFNYTIQTLRFKSPSSGELFFAGPFGLTEIMESYRRQCPTGASVRDIVIVPPSYSFYSYRNNRLNSSKADHIPERLRALRDRCNRLISSRNPAPPQLVQYCSDVTNMDPITDVTEPVFAIHDVEKPGASYFGVGGRRFFSENPTDIRLVLKNVMNGREFI